MQLPVERRVSGRIRKPGLDVIRGLLVLLVMIGHCLELYSRENFLTWFGFGFRMPLFIGMAGYLFNLDAARGGSTADLFARYRNRLIVPWLFACAFHILTAQPLSWLTPLEAVIRPPFHLWFVPVIMLYFLIAQRCGLSRTRMLVLSVPASLAAMYLFGVGHAIEQFGAWVPDRRYFTFLLYFAFGMWIAERTLTARWALMTLPVSAVGFLWWSGLFDSPAPLAEVAAQLLATLPLIALLPVVAEWPLPFPVLRMMGKDSLYFYLWHPFAFALLMLTGMPAIPMMLFAITALLLVRWAVRRMPLARLLVGILPPSIIERRQHAGDIRLIPESAT